MPTSSSSDAEYGQSSSPSTRLAGLLVALNPISAYASPRVTALVGRHHLSTSLDSSHPAFSLARRHTLRNSAPVMKRMSAADMDAEIARMQSARYEEGEEMLMNDDIPYDEIRVSILREEADGVEEALGVMSTDDALDLANQEDLDLVLWVENAKPPMCKILDYGEYKYLEKKRKKEAKKMGAGQMVVKKLRISHKMGDNDFDTAAKKATKFLKAGNKVNFEMKFRGREITFADAGKEMMLRMAAELKAFGSMAKEPAYSGKSMEMSVNPKPKQN